MQWGEMKGIKKWSLKYPLGAAGILLAAAGALILYWAFGREQASELVVGLIGAGLSWLAAGLLFCVLWSIRTPMADRVEDVNWLWLKGRLDPYYGLFFPETDRDAGALRRFLGRYTAPGASPFLSWLMPLYLFIRMAEACAGEEDWSHFLDMSKELADVICDRLSAVGCFEEGRKLQYLRALGEKEGTGQCAWFGQRLPVLQEAISQYVRIHFDEFSGREPL